MQKVLPHRARSTAVSWQRWKRLVGIGPLAWFFVLAFALTWAWWVPLAVSGRVVDRGWRPTHLPGEMGPLLAAVVIVATTTGRDGVRDLLSRMGRWRIGLGWWIVAFSPLLAFGIVVALIRAFGGDWLAWRELDDFGGAPEAGVVGLWLILLVTTGFGEEVGWRGYAIPRLQQRHAPLTASLFLSPFWMLWHIPVFVVVATYRDFELIALPGFLLGIAAGSVVLTWLFNRSGGSILAVSVWHASYNLVSGAKAVEGATAAIISGMVMALAVVLILLELRATRRGASSVLGPRPDSPAYR